jgi:anti-sigma B factor antagonist
MRAKISPLISHLSKYSGIDRFNIIGKFLGLEEEDMHIEVENRGDVSVMHCGGSLDADSIAAFKKVAYDLVDKGVTRLVVDFANLTFVDSMGLGALISLLRRVRQRQGDVKVVALTDDVKTIFEITRLHRLFEVCADLNTAIKRFENE